jgi:hypothetical protein
MRSLTVVTDALSQVVKSPFHLVEAGRQALNLGPDRGDFRRFRSQGVTRVVGRPLGRFADVGTAAVPDVNQAVTFQQSHDFARCPHGYAVIVHQVSVRRETVSGAVFALLNGPPY